MADININLQNNKNAIATANNMVLSLNQNQFRIVAGEENATTFEIKYDTARFAGYYFYVEMVNAKGRGIDATILEDDSSVDWVLSATTFKLPKGMAVAGYGYISIKALKGEEKVVFMPVKLPVSNTIPEWQQYINDMTSTRIDANGHLIALYADGTTSDMGLVRGNGIANIRKTSSVGLVDTYTITYDDGTTDTFTVQNGAPSTFSINDDGELIATY